MTFLKDDEVDMRRLGGKRWTLRVAASAVVASGVIAFGAGVAQAQSTLKSVVWGSWTQYSQQESNWCWAAGAKMLIQREKGSSPTECAEVNYAKGTSSCANVTGSMDDIYKVLHHWGVNSAPSYSGTVTFGDVRFATTNGGGVITRVTWNSNPNGTGHIAPLIGSQTTGSGNVYITYIQDGNVSGSWITYAQFINGTAGLGAPYTTTHYIVG